MSIADDPSSNEVSGSMSKDENNHQDSFIEKDKLANVYNRDGKVISTLNINRYESEQQDQMTSFYKHAKDSLGSNAEEDDDVGSIRRKSLIKKSGQFQSHHDVTLAQQREKQISPKMLSSKSIQS